MRWTDDTKGCRDRGTKSSIFETGKREYLVREPACRFLEELKSNWKKRRGCDLEMDSSGVRYGGRDVQP
jgi:hypothetical protein